MRYSYILSLILLITPAFSLVCKSNTTFNLILSEDKKAFKSRQFHIFYDKHFKPIAELIKCQIDGAKIVKQVILEEVSSKLSLERICTLKKYEDKLKDPLKRNRMFMATISEQEKFKSPATCSAQNQFNVMRTPNHEWAVQIRGHISNVVLPMDKNIDHFTRESLAFALNALFFATTYGIGDSEFKTIGGATLKEKWIRMFPASVSEKDASAKFLIRSMFVAFSVIIKRRELLDAACFATNHITDNLKATTLSFQNPTSEKISQLLRSAGEALKEGYLKEIALVITENPMEDVALEVYTFRVHYDEQGFPTAVLGMNSEEGQGAVNSNVNLQKVAKFDFRGTASVRDQLVLLVKSLHALTQKILKPLPEKRSFNLRLEYMPHTPDTKSVSGFTDADHFYTPHNDMQIATIGHLRPGHHAALLDCNSVFIEDSFGAETTLKRYNDVFAKDLESASVLQHNELYSSFADESNAKIPEVTAERSEPEDGSEDKLATTIGNMDLDASQSTPKDVKRGGKRARRHQKPSAHPYS